MLPAAKSTPVSHSSMSAAEFGAENLLRPLSQIRLGLKRCEERQVPSLLAVLCYPAADQLQGWPQLSLWKLIHQVLAPLPEAELRPALELIRGRVTEHG